MKLYLDEDSCDRVLARLLKSAGHDVRSPAEIGRLHASDAVQFTSAIREGRAFLTGNYDHFEELHELVIASGGRHSGVLAVRRDNNPRKDMTARGTLNALAKLIQSGVALANELYVLNDWR